ncbi:MAG: PAT family beta-lactamase induction signal transducer AmpG, partial [bacterium]
MSNSDLSPPPDPTTSDSILPSPGDLPGWRPWTWVPSLYYVQGLPYTIVNVVSVPMYKTLGIANSDITFWTSWFGFIWALKALWSPFVDGVSTKRRWTVAMQTALVPVTIAVAFS